MGKWLLKLGVLCLLLAWSTGCVHKPLLNVLVLSYQDFGPQALVYPYIGYEWYQWNTHGDSDPNKRDAVYVVVYDGMSLLEAKRRYPVNEPRLQDYRYLTLKEACRLLNLIETEITQLGRAEPALEETVKRTLQSISNLRGKLDLHFERGNR